MARMTWTLFGLILVVVVSAAMIGAAAVGEEDERVAAGGAGTVGGEGHGARSAETGRAGEEATEVGDQGVGHRARLEEGEVGSIGGGDDSAFHDLSELSSRSRPSKLHQGTIFELFEAERGHRRQSGEGTSVLVMEEEELDSRDDDDDADFDIEAEAPGEDDDKEEQGAEAEEQPAQVHCGAKRRRSTRV